MFLLPFGPLINIIAMAVTTKESDLKDSTMSTVRGIMKEIPVVEGYRRVKM